MNFPNIAKDLFLSFFYFLSVKRTSCNTPETRKPLFAQQAPKNPFFKFFSGKAFCWGNEFQLAKLPV